MTKNYRQYRKGSPVIDYSYDDEEDFNDEMDKTALGLMKGIYKSVINGNRPLRDGRWGQRNKTRSKYDPWNYNYERWDE